MKGIHDWERFKLIHSTGKIRIIWREGPFLSKWARANNLNLPLLNKKKWVIQRMLHSETEFERVHLTYDIYEK